MECKPGAISGLLFIQPKIFTDPRGSFFESYNASSYQSMIPEQFVQDNESYSIANVLRGMHMQTGAHAQGKLVRVVEGEIFDVVVDLRLESPHFGTHATAVLSGENKLQLWIPPGFAHGFLVRSKSVIFSYKCTTPYHKESEITLKWNDPAVGIPWKVTDPVISDKDMHGESLAAIRARLLALSSATTS